MNEASTIYDRHPIRCILKSSHDFMRWVLCRLRELDVSSSSLNFLRYYCPHCLVLGEIIV